MGLFDDIKFVGQNKLIPADIPAEILMSGWQTKDLYNVLYHLKIEDDKIWYVDVNGTGHELPLTASFEIHTFVPDHDPDWYSYQVTAVNGAITEISKSVENRFTPFPIIPAMDADAEVWAQNMKNSNEIWDLKLKQRPFSQKISTAFRDFYWNLKQVINVRALVRALSSFTGIFK